jgi:hypothetical protein
LICVLPECKRQADFDGLWIEAKSITMDYQWLRLDLQCQQNALASEYWQKGFRVAASGNCFELAENPVRAIDRRVRHRKSVFPKSVLRESAV